MQAALNQVEMASQKKALQEQRMNEVDQHEALDMFMAMTQDEAKQKLQVMTDD